MRCLLVVAFLVVAMSPAAAAGLGNPSAGYIYFHRAGADLQGHNEAVEGCAIVSAQTLAPVVFRMGGPGILSNFLSNLEQDSAAHVNFVANIENCMVVHGWDVVRLEDAEGAHIAALDQPGQAAALAPWVGSAAVHGDVVRRYEPIVTLDPASAAFLSRAGDSLSFTADADKIAGRASMLPVTGGKPNWQLVPAQDDPARVTAGATVIVVRAHTIAPAQAWINFVRLATPADSIAPAQGQVVFGMASPTRLFWSHGSFLEKTSAFVVPPGRWRIASVYGTGFCLGGPAFDVHAGEAVFAGSFDAASPYAMDVALEPARAGLGDAALAQRLIPAQYRNGEAYDCAAFPATMLYVLELPGVPFADDYASGSRAAGAPAH